MAWDDMFHNRDSSVVVVPDVNPVGKILHDVFPGVIDSGAFSILLLLFFIVAVPVVIYLIKSGRITNS
jgi:hypothetical protein